MDKEFLGSMGKFAAIVNIKLTALDKALQEHNPELYDTYKTYFEELKQSDKALQQIIAIYDKPENEEGDDNKAESNGQL